MTLFRGFSSLLVLLVVAILGAGAWYWYSTSGTVFPSATTEITHDTPDLSSATLVEEDERYALLVRTDDTEHSDAYFVKDKRIGSVIELKDTNDLSWDVIARISSDAAGKYVAIDQGTSVSRGIVVFSLSDGEFLGTFCSVGSFVFWHDYGIYRSCFNELDVVGWEAGLPNIEAIDIRTGATTTLMNAHIGADYVLYQNLKLSGDTLSVEVKSTKMGSQGWLELTDTPPVIHTSDLSAHLRK